MRNFLLFAVLALALGLAVKVTVFSRIGYACYSTLTWRFAMIATT